MRAGSKNIINQQILEENFNAGLLEFEALINNINEDRKAKLIELFEEFSEEFSDECSC